MAFPRPGATTVSSSRPMLTPASGRRGSATISPRLCGARTRSPGGSSLEPAEAALLPPALHARGALESRYETLLVEIFARLDPEECNPYPNHWTASGATLAVRRRTYLAVGGMPPLSVGEDRAFIAAIRARGRPCSARAGYRSDHVRAARRTGGGRCRGHHARALCRSRRVMRLAARNGFTRLGSDFLAPQSTVSPRQGIALVERALGTRPCHRAIGGEADRRRTRLRLRLRRDRSRE